MAAGTYSEIGTERVHLRRGDEEPAPKLKRSKRLGRMALPGFQALQHPKLVDRPPSGDGWLHEIKYDGYRMQLAVGAGGFQWFSRNGNDWTDRLADFTPEIVKLPDGVYDGEVCALDERGHPDFSALRSAMGFRQRGKLNGSLVFFPFDLLMDVGGDLRSSPLIERKARLAAAVRKASGTRIRHVDGLPSGGGGDLLKAACGMGLEGIVSKRLDASYTGGDRRAPTWLKAKCRPGQEVVIGGYEMEGARFSALLTGVYEGDALRYVGHVGTGFSAAVVFDLLHRLQPLVTTKSPFEGGPRSKARLRWVRPELVANIEIAEWTASGMLRQASYKGLRTDKAPREVVREQP